MSQVEEFVKIVEGVKDHDVKVVVVTGKPGSGKSKVLREAAEEKKWDYIDCRLLITEKFLINTVAFATVFFLLENVRQKHLR